MKPTTNFKLDESFYGQYENDYKASAVFQLKSFEKTKVEDFFSRIQQNY